MDISIRKFLLIYLLLAITVTTSITAIGNYYLDKTDIEKHLDSLLSQAAIAFTAFADRNMKLQNWQETQTRIDAIHFQGSDAQQAGVDPALYHYESKYRFQVWKPNHVLFLKSGNAPSQMLSDGRAGFSDVLVKDLFYRVFTNYDPKTQLTFIVAEPYYERNKLSYHIMSDDIYIMFLSYPLSGLLIWIIIGRGLSSIGRIASELKHRDPKYLEPVDIEAVPLEIQPLIAELNTLFLRLKEAFEREKRFASDAAHELRTPLAAIRTQSQVALLAAGKSTDLMVILQNVIMGVDRATHIVHQLLTMSRLVPEARKISEIVPCNLAELARDVTGQLAPLAFEKNIDLNFNAPVPCFIQGNVAAVVILIRNLIDNAIRYTPKEGAVMISVTRVSQGIQLTVVDNGPGIPEEYRQRVMERFFRLLGNESPGSGLGLSIVKQIVDLHDASMTMKASHPDGTGLTIEVVFQAQAALSQHD